MDPVLTGKITGTAGCQRRDPVISELTGMPQSPQVFLKKMIRHLLRCPAPFRMPAEREMKFPVVNECVPGPEGLPGLIQFHDGTVIHPVFQVAAGHVPEFMGALSPAAAVMTTVMQIENVEQSFISKRDHVPDPGIEAVRGVIHNGYIPPDPVFITAYRAQIVGEHQISDGGGIDPELWRFLLADTVFPRLFPVNDFPVTDDVEIYAVEQERKLVFRFRIPDETQGKTDPPRGIISLLKECGFKRFCTFEKMQPIFHEL